LFVLPCFVLFIDFSLEFMFASGFWCACARLLFFVCARVCSCVACCYFLCSIGGVMSVETDFFLLSYLLFHFGCVGTVP